MLTLGRGNSRTCTGVTRRDFLRVGGVGLGACGLSLGGLNALRAAESRSDRSVILLLLVGGPSQLETFDPKPDAPAEIRGPFGSIATSCPGIRVSEHLPRLASRMDRVALVRSVYHDAAPIHETGHQLLQTGRLCRTGEESPHVGSVLARFDRTKRSLPPSIILPGADRADGRGHSRTANRPAGWARRSTRSIWPPTRPPPTSIPAGRSIGLGPSWKRSRSRRIRFSTSRHEMPSIWPKRAIRSGTLTAARLSARAACSPAGWLRPEYASSRSICSTACSTA